MGMAASSTHWTIARVRALPDDGRRYEVIDGELYASPAPTWEHQAAVQELLIQLRTHLAGTAIGRVVLSPADVEFRDDRIVEPDLFVVPLIDGRASRDWQEAGRLLLTVEVISPATARLDRVVKRALYQQEGVPEYWIVDVASRLIERWTPGDDGPEILADKLRWQPDAARASLELILQAIFHAVATTWTNSQVHKKSGASKLRSAATKRDGCQITIVSHSKATDIPRRMAGDSLAARGSVVILSNLREWPSLISRVFC